MIYFYAVHAHLTNRIVIRSKMRYSAAYRVLIQPLIIIRLALLFANIILSTVYFSFRSCSICSTVKPVYFAILSLGSLSANIFLAISMAFSCLAV